MGEVVDPSQDLSSPYHVSSSDNPSFFIVPIILEGSNYHRWSCSFQMSLISKNKIGFIDGTIDAPNHTKSLFPAWQRDNMLERRFLNPSHRASSVWTMPLTYGMI